MSVARHHAEWLSLIEVSGPFLSMPVLLRIFPQGLDQRDPDKARELRMAYEEWLEKPDAPGHQYAWVNFVLTRLLEFPSAIITEGQNIPAGLEAPMAEYGEILRPDFAIVAPSSHDIAGIALVQIYPSSQDLDSPVSGKHWKASPATRMTELLHKVNIPLGMVTNGEQWMLIFAPQNETTGYISWYAAIWQDEPITLRAFHSLLHVRRFFGVAHGDTLLALLKESAHDQQEVTDQLGYQVRRAVEMLVWAFDRLDQDSGRTLLSGIDPKVLYDGALTVMMRLVFLFSAEERDLLRLGDPLYDDNYAVSTLREQLHEAADQYGEEVLERRFDAWSRLLATFRAVHGGVDHEVLRLPAYGGTLFDPDRYPFLEGRPTNTNWYETPAEPLAINNRVVLHLLESLQMLQIKLPGSGPAEARRISFRALGIENIGHVYEGLLDHTAIRANTTFLSLKGSKNKEPEIALEQLEELLAQGEDKLIGFLKEETGRSESALSKALRESSFINEHTLLIACGQNTGLKDRVLPFAGLIREDSFGMPVVILSGSVFVTEGTTRRSTGTHYTPRSLTEPIVQHTLEPLVYEGPAEGWPKEQWRLKSPKEILALKVCDMAMGSGAFLVEVCRYLSERLVEAWEDAEKANPKAIIITPEGDFSAGDSTERLLPQEPAERLAIARRAVADRCIYGVDINPMAVEMAKLSLWLITVQRDRPFTFLDHALKCGDSLLGVSSINQIKKFSLRPGEQQDTLSSANLIHSIDEASSKRLALESLSSNDFSQIETKNHLHAEAEAATAKVKALADCLIAFEMRGLNGKQYEERRALAADQVKEEMHKPLDKFQVYVKEQLCVHRPFHWPVEFPEVFTRDGFSAVVGNPPFLGGVRISEIYGVAYNDYLVLTNPPAGKKSDLAIYFFRRATDILSEQGCFGLIATKTVAQGKSRQGGLDEIIAKGAAIYHAETAFKWPGVAAVLVCIIHVTKLNWVGTSWIDGREFAFVDGGLIGAEGKESAPDELLSNDGLAYQGSSLLGMGFVLTPEEAKRIVSSDPKSSEVITPYLGGENINRLPKLYPIRYAINFGEMPEDEAHKFIGAWRHVEQFVKPERMEKDVTAYPRLVNEWWKYWHSRQALYQRIRRIEQIIVCARVSKRLMVRFAPGSWTFNDKVIVIARNTFAEFAILQSDFHEDWAWKYGSTLKADLNYVAKTCHGTFPFPDRLEVIEDVGQRYENLRHVIMVKLHEGLTSIYNRFHNSDEKSEDIERLRAMHVEMNQIVAAAYGWNDLDLGYGFRKTKHGERFTLSESTRRIVLDRLLELNHQRYAEEVKAGLHEKKTKKTGIGGKRGKKKGVDPQAVLFE